MNRHTVAGDANVSLLCATFGLSRAAYYAEVRRQRGGAVPAATVKTNNLIALPRRPRHTAAEVVLLRIRCVSTKLRQVAREITEPPPRLFAAG